MNAIAHEGDSETASCLTKHPGDLMNLLHHCEQHSVQWIITHAEKHSFRNGIFKGEEGGGGGGHSIAS